MREFFTWFDGNKTHIGVVVTSILAALTTDKVRELGVIPEQWQGWITLLSIVAGMLTANAARSSITKVQTSQVELAEIQLDAMELEEEAKAAVLQNTKALKAAAKKSPKAKEKTPPKGKS